MDVAGFEVAAVPNAISYYRALAERTFTVAVVDLGLPDEDGEALVESTRRTTGSRIIVVTARDTRGTRVDCYRGGADLFLPKPVDGLELEAAIRSLAARAEAREADRKTQVGDGARGMKALVAAASEVVEHRSAEGTFRTLVDQSLVGTFVVQDGLFVYANERFAKIFAKIFGFALADLVGVKRLLDLGTEESGDQVRESLRMPGSGKRSSGRFTIAALRKDGTPVDVEVNDSVVDFEGRPALLGVAFDVTESRREQRQLNTLAFYDPLTDLPNRALFFDRLGQVLAASRRSGTPFAVLVLDLDGFKGVNDTFGHQAGDALLQSVAERLRSCVRASDTVGRMGGDEFVVLLTHMGAANDAGVVAEKILLSLETPFFLGDRALRVGASIGLCIFPEDGVGMEELLERADAAMYESKARGKNTWTRYRSELSGGRPVRLFSLRWSEEFHVGVPEIDEQRSRLAELFNRVAESVTSGGGEEEVGSLLDDLVVHARHHFATEEGLMERFQTPGALAHQQEHRKLLEDLLSIRRGASSASLMLTIRSLKECLMAHIAGPDRRLAAELLAAGAREAGRWGTAEPRGRPLPAAPVPNG